MTDGFFIFQARDQKVLVCRVIAQYFYRFGLYRGACFFDALFDERQGFFLAYCVEDVESVRVVSLAFHVEIGKHARINGHPDGGKRVVCKPVQILIV